MHAAIFRVIWQVPDIMNYPLGVKFRYENEPLLWEVEDVYSQLECDNFIELIESSKPKLATNNALYRDQDRVMIDDSIIALELFNRIKQGWAYFFAYAGVGYL